MSISVEYLIVAAGGGWNNWGGAGAGGVLIGTVDLDTGVYSVIVGLAGSNGTQSPTNTPGANGSNSVFNSLTAIGGGYGGYQAGSTDNVTDAGVGGSGGGAGGKTFIDPDWLPVDGHPGASGTSDQGNAGGTDAQNGAGGGGGYAGIGGNAVTNFGADGGAGYASNISGASQTYATGGGGWGITASGNTPPSVYGGGAGNNRAAQNGVVILRYLTSAGIVTGGTITTDGLYTIHTFTVSGNFTITSISSPSPSASISPSTSVSSSASESPSASQSPSASMSPSASVSLSRSPSASFSPSASYSPSASVSPSAVFPDGVWTFRTESVDDLVQMAREIVGIETQLQSNYSAINTLGTWTPAFQTSASVVYLTQSGRYQKIGRTVMFTGVIALSDIADLTGDIVITGLPFSSMTSSADDVGGCVVLYCAGMISTDMGMITGVCDANANTIRMYVTKDTNEGALSLQASAFTNASRLVFSGSYFSAL